MGRNQKNSPGGRWLRPRGLKENEKMETVRPCGWVANPFAGIPAAEWPGTSPLAGLRAWSRPIFQGGGVLAELAKF